MASNYSTASGADPAPTSLAVPANLRPRAIVVSNLDRTADENQVRLLFGQCGTVVYVDLRPPNEHGFSLAEVGFATPNEALAALRFAGQVAFGAHLEIELLNPGRPSALPRTEPSPRASLRPLHQGQQMTYASHASQRVAHDARPHTVYHAPNSAHVNRGQNEDHANHTNLYVLNLPLEATTQQLEQLFSLYGPVTHTMILAMLDGQARRRGFIDVASPDAARRAIEELNGYVWNGYPIEVSYAIVQRSPGTIHEQQNRYGPTLRSARPARMNDGMMPAPGRYRDPSPFSSFYPEALPSRERVPSVPSFPGVADEYPRSSPFGTYTHLPGHGEPSTHNQWRASYPLVSSGRPRMQAQPDPTTIFLSGLPDEVSDDMLWQMGAHFGHLLQAQVDSASPDTMRIGWMTFADSEAAVWATEQLNGRRINSTRGETAVLRVHMTWDTTGMHERNERSNDWSSLYNNLPTPTSLWSPNNARRASAAPLSSDAPFTSSSTMTDDTRSPWCPSHRLLHMGSEPVLSVDPWAPRAEASLPRADEPGSPLSSASASQAASAEGLSAPSSRSSLRSNHEPPTPEWDLSELAFDGGADEAALYRARQTLPPASTSSASRPRFASAFSSEPTPAWPPVKPTISANAKPFHPRGQARGRATSSWPTVGPSAVPSATASAVPSIGPPVDPSLAAQFTSSVASSTIPSIAPSAGAVGAPASGVWPDPARPSSSVSSGHTVTETDTLALDGMAPSALAGVNAALALLHDEEEEQFSALGYATQSSTSHPSPRRDPGHVSSLASGGPSPVGLNPPGSNASGLVAPAPTTPTGPPMGSPSVSLSRPRLASFATSNSVMNTAGLNEMPLGLEGLSGLKLE